MSVRNVVLCLAAFGLLAACNPFSNDRMGDNDPDATKRANDPYHTDPDYSGANPDIFGDRYASNANGNKGILASLFSSDDKNATPGAGGAGVGVNSYLWRATLDTLSFLPLASADPFGGVVITDWYSPPDQQAERFKVNIFILGRELRADGVRASVFRQRKDSSGQWADAPVDQATGTDLENAILTRARQLRLSTAAK
jgi:hypothetical protein